MRLEFVRMFWGGFLAVMIAKPVKEILIPANSVGKIENGSNSSIFH